MDRRDFIGKGLLGAAFGMVVGPACARSATPDEIEGPFYPVFAQKDRDFDLTRIEGKQGVARGKVIFIRGQVLDTDGQPVEEAIVDLWQANAEGRYRHPRDGNPAPLDPFFQGWAIVPSGRDGTFRFKTIFPGAYPTSPGWMRPPHIHFKVTKPGYAELVTQMYFSDQALNASDLLLQRKDEHERQLMIASKIQGDPESYEYKIVLKKVTVAEV